MAAISQIRHQRSDGRAYYEKKVAEGKTHKEALRCLKRRISDAIYAALAADARRAAAAACPEGLGGQPGNHSESRAAGSHPAHRHFGQATPRPRPTLRPRPALGAGLGIPRSLPPRRRRSRRSRWSARSEATTNDLEVRRGDGDTPPRGRPR